jgi:regulator of replication initiation timing
MMIDDTILYMGGFGAVLIIIIIYIMMKDSEQSKKVRYLEHGIDKLHNQLYSVESELKVLKKALEEGALDTQKDAMDENAILQLVKSEVKQILEPIGQALSETENSMKEFQATMQNRFESVENHVKQTVMMPETSKSDEEKIVSMYKSGYTVDEIAKHFRIGTGEVELIIRFADINA